MTTLPKATNHVDTLLSTDELSSLLNIPVKTIYRWRTVGAGPAAIRLGKHLRYQRSTVLKWLSEREESSDGINH